MRPRDVLKAELIGLDIEIIDARNPQLKGLRGKVVEETRNTMTICQNDSEKKLIKDQITFSATIGHIEGDLAQVPPPMAH